MISKGCIYHLVRVQDLDSEVPPIESVPVESEFLEVFLIDHPSIPPKREIELGFATGYKSHNNSSLSHGSSRVERVKVSTDVFTR